VSSPDSAHVKSRIRAEMRSLLSGIGFPELIEKSGRLSEAFFDWAEENRTEFGGRFLVSFCPFENEPQINIEKEFRGEPYRAAYVRIEDWTSRRMSAREARRDLPDLWEILEEGRVSVDQPRADQPLCVPDSIAAILVPGLAFDGDFQRLGRGAGFYDRFLKEHPSALRIGVSFDEQRISTLPVEDFDEPVDMLLTDRGLFYSKSYGEWRIRGKIEKRQNPR